MASASGLSTKESEIERIAKFCNKWDSLYWNQGEAPSIKDIRFACGSMSALSNMIFEAVNDLLGTPARGLASKKVEEDSDTSDNSSAHEYYSDDDEIIAGSDCCNQAAFLQVHAADVKKF